MIFSSYTFLLIFLPSVLAVFSAHAMGWLTSMFWLRSLIFASLLFYAFWDWHDLFILIGSIVVNYTVGKRLALTQAKHWLVIAITFNLVALAWFKYRIFIAGIVPFPLLPIEFQAGIQLALPLGISFFTFQQIAWQVDVYRQRISLPNFEEYIFFVSFFPQLIAGPIVHAREVLPQIRPRWPKPSTAWLASGVLLLCIGLAKKVLIADNLASPVDALYLLANQGAPLGGGTPWLASFGYGLQLYFDFSGYADMAIGLGLILGIKLPDNFSSPYRSISIIDFWRRWHITLSHFLKDYLYIPLGGRTQKYRNLMLTMLLGGLWHGAGWQFILWGGLHGTALCIAHGWRSWASRPLPSYLTFPLTLGFVMLTWIFFRADTLESASALYHAIFSPWELLSSLTFIDKGQLIGGPYGELIQFIALGLIIALCLPNSNKITKHLYQRLTSSTCQHASNYILLSGTISGILLFLILKQLYNQPNQAFLYFEF